MRKWKGLSLIILSIIFLVTMFSYSVKAEYLIKSVEDLTFGSVQELEEMLNKRNGDPRVLMKAGIFYYLHALGKLNFIKVEKKEIRKYSELAHKCLDEALKIDPDNNLIKSWLGAVCLYRAQFGSRLTKIKFSNKGIKLLNEAVKANKEDINIRFNRVRSYINLPTKYFRVDQFIEQDCLFVAEKIEQDNDMKEIEYYRNSLLEMYFYLGIIYNRIGEYEGSNYYLKRVIEVVEKNEYREMAEKLLKENNKHMK